MYCKAFERGTIPSSYSSVKTGGYVVYSNTKAQALNASVIINNLSPDTTYNVYCGTEDYENRIMELADVLASRQQVTTTCCRQIDIMEAIDQQIVYISGSIIPENPMTFKLDSQPTGPMYVLVTYYQVLCVERTHILNESGHHYFAK